MNKVCLIGRLTQDPQIRYTKSNIAFSRFNLAENEGYGDKQRTNFINIKVWGKLAETVFNNLKKGNKIGLTGRLESGSYQKEDGSTEYTTDVVMESLEFLDKKSTINVDNQESFQEDISSFIDDDGLPF